jgi:hypothetical protein
VKNFLNVVKKLTAKKSVLVVKLADMPEAAVVAQVRNTLKMARDYFQKHGRTILAVDLQTHLDFFDEAVRFDLLEKSPVLLATDKNRN